MRLYQHLSVTAGNGNGVSNILSDKAGIVLCPSATLSDQGCKRDLGLVKASEEIDIEHLLEARQMHRS